MKDNFSLAYIKMLGDGDAEFTKTIIETIKDEFPTEVSKYNQHLTEKNYGKAAEAVHKLKHKIGILGNQNMYDFVVQYEKTLKINNHNKPQETQMFNKILSSLEAYLNEL